MRTRILFLVLAVAAAMAQTAEMRPARSADLVGTWQMVSLSKPENVEGTDTVLAPYQLFQFQANGRMKHMTATKAFTSLALFQAAPAITRYTLNKSGTLTLTNPNWNAPRQYKCSLIVAPATSADPKQPRAGDIILTGSEAPNQPTWSKLLRRLP